MILFLFKVLLFVCSLKMTLFVLLWCLAFVRVIGFEFLLLLLFVLLLFGYDSSWLLSFDELLVLLFFKHKLP